MKVFISVLMTSIFWVIIGLVIYRQHYDEMQKVDSEVHLKEISQIDRDFYKSKAVNIRAGGSFGSGCEIKPGYYLTALHIIMGPIWDHETISVNDKKATLVESSKVIEDYALLTINAEVDPRLAKLPEYEFTEGEDVIIVGNPGNQDTLVQPGKIINTKVNDANGYPKKSSKKVFTVYVEHGISGGCVYPYGSKTPVAVFIKKDENRDQHLGEVSVVTKSVE